MKGKYQRNDKELIPGIVFLGIGAIFLWGTIPLFGLHDLGAFPGVCAASLAVVGVIKIIKGLTSSVEVKVKLAGWKEYSLVLASILSFGLLVEPLGVVLSTALCIIISCLNTIRIRWKEILIIAASCAAFVYIVFVRLFEVNVPVWPFGF